MPSFNKRPIFYKNAIKKKFDIIGSAHNLKEINEKKKQGCTSIFLSPIFKTSKSKKFLGINKFNLLKLNKKGNFVMLGGMNENNLKKIKMLNINRVAGISFYKKKPAFN